MDEQLKAIKECLDRIESLSRLTAKKVLSIEDVEILTNLKTQTIRKLVRQRKLPCYRPNKNILYFKRSEIEDWMTANRQSSLDEMLYGNNR